MTNTLYQLPRDIRDEFSVDENGQVWASARATARLAGVCVSSLIDSRRSVLQRLKSAGSNEVIDKYLSECLKPFAGFDYWVTGKIPDTLVFAIVTHYAYESKVAANDTARATCLAMGSVGVRTFFNQQLGLDQPKVNADTNSQIERLTKAVVQIAGDLQQIKATLNTQTTAKNHHLGIADIVNGLATTRLLPPADLKEPFTAREYVRVIHGVELTTSESHSLGRFAVDAFTAIDKTKPAKGTHGNKRIYWHRDLQAWEVVYKSWLNSR